MNKHFNSCAFTNDYLKSDLYKNNSFFKLQELTGIPKSTLHDIANNRCDKLSVNNFFAICKAAKLKPLNYMK